MYYRFKNGGGFTTTIDTFSLLGTRRLLRELPKLAEYGQPLNGLGAMRFQIPAVQTNRVLTAMEQLGFKAV